MAKRARRRIRSMIRDFSLALCISSLAMLAIPAGEAAAGFAVWKIATPNTQAQPQAITAVSWSTSGPASAMPLYRHTNRSEAMVILALAISTLAAFNMWILRHLRQVYLSNKRASKRLLAEQTPRCCRLIT